MICAVLIIAGGVKRLRELKLLDGCGVGGSGRQSGIARD